MMYIHVFVGGTFGGLHKGHEAVLTRAFLDGEKVTIGLTSDLFISRFKSQFFISKSQTNHNTQNKKIQNKTIQLFSIRKKRIERWLALNKYSNKAHIIPIDDPYEPAASGDFDALIVTKDNRRVGEEINNLRTQRGLKALALIDVPLVAAEDNQPISSTRIRNGEIDGDGRLVMPDFLIPALRKPMGRVLSDKDLRDRMYDLRRKIIITVGDLTTKTFIDLGIVPHLSIIDEKVGRKPFHGVLNLLQPEKVSPFQAKRVKSGPGFISKKARQAIRGTLERLATQARQARQERQAELEKQVKLARQVRQVKLAKRARQAVQKTCIIVVDGEEDLLALPAILSAPIGSVVLYGQPASPDASQGGPNQGIVCVRIDQQAKIRVQSLLKKFLVSK